MPNFQKFSRLRPKSKFYTRETRKPTGDDIKNQRVELTNILHWRKNTYAWLTQNKRNGWVTFQCKKTLWYIGLAIKASWRVENRDQYRNWIIQLKVKFTLRSHNTYPLIDSWKWLYETIVSLSPRHVKPLSYEMRDELVCKTISISRRLVSLHINGDYNFESELELCIQSILSKF